MITTKELNYVTSWASRVPYPGIEYATKTAEKLIAAFNEYNKFYIDKEYDIILSNGEQVAFEILSKNLCHMLGIDYQNLKGEYFDEFRKDIINVGYDPRSYDLLKGIIDNIENVIKYEVDNNKRVLNYYRIMIKCSIFEKLSDFSRFNFGVINFDKDEYQNNAGVSFNGRSEKLLYVQSNETSAPYFMMGILPSEDFKEKYAVETLIAPTNTKDFFQNQEVVIPTQILVTTSEKMDKLEAKPEEKIALLNQYKSIIKDHDIPNKLNIYGDYEAMIAEQSQVRKRVKA